MAELGPPPPGGDQSRAPLIIGLSTALTVISTLCVITRFITRFYLTRNAGFDDALILTSLIFQWANFGITLKSISYGFGRHLFYLIREPQNLVLALKWNLISNPFGIIGLALPRLAIAMFIARVVSPVQRREVWVLYFLATTMIIASIISAIILFVRCTPHAKAWNIGIEGSCWNPKVTAGYSIFVTAYSAFNDFVFAIYPVTIIVKLQMSRRRKIGISILMGLGLLACVCAIIRSTEFGALDHDITWTAVNTLVTTLVELNVLIICACIPTFLPLIQQLTGKKSYLSNPHRYPTQSASSKGNSNSKASSSHPPRSWQALQTDNENENDAVPLGRLKMRDDSFAGVDSVVYGGDGAGDENGDGKIGEHGCRPKGDVEEGGKGDGGRDGEGEGRSRGPPVGGIGVRTEVRHRWDAV